MSLDLVRAAQRELSGVSAVTEKVGTSDAWPYWIFRWDAFVDIEGTGERSIVLAQRGGWGANRHNTARFPRLQVLVYADVSRDSLMNPSAQDAYERALELCDAVDSVLHVPRGAELKWGNGSGEMRIISSVRSGEPDVVPVPDGDGVVRAEVYYEVQVG